MVVVVVFVFVFFDVRRVVTGKYDAPARTVAISIATAAVTAAKERRRIADARAAVVATTEAEKFTDKVNGTIDAAHGSNGGGGSPTLGGHMPAAPRPRHHPPLPSAVLVTCRGLLASHVDL